MALVTRRTARRGSANWSATHTFSGRESLTLTPTSPTAILYRRQRQQLSTTLDRTSNGFRNGARSSRALSVDWNVVEAMAGIILYTKILYTRARMPCTVLVF